MSASLSLIGSVISYRTQHGTSDRGIARMNRAESLARRAADLAHSAVTARERVLRDCARVVAEVMEQCLHHSRLIKTAEGEAAKLIGISPRRVRAWRAGEVYSVTAWEAELIHRARHDLALRHIATLRAALDREMARLSDSERECLNRLFPRDCQPDAAGAHNSPTISPGSGLALPNEAGAGPSPGRCVRCAGADDG